ncbi:MAG: polysaccharide deacetylase family protein [Chloroflexi bacterium]|nr:polysaccharide deacetylase family protein [Chloroflexota bacterium]
MFIGGILLWFLPQVAGISHMSASDVSGMDNSHLPSRGTSEITTSATATTVVTVTATVLATETATVTATPMPRPSPSATKLPFPPLGATIPVTTNYKIPVFMYHHIDRLPLTASASLRLYTVSPEQFAAQMDYLYQHGYQTIGLAELAEALTKKLPLPQRLAVITFDDGWTSQYTEAFPVLQRYGFKATFFLVNNYLTGTVYMSKVQAQSLAAAGMEIGAHTLNHSKLTTVTLAELQRQLVSSKAGLERLTGLPVTVFAYPYGSYNTTVVSQVGRAGFVAAASSSAGYLQKASQLYALPRFGLSYSDNLAAFASHLPWSAYTPQKLSGSRGLDFNPRLLRPEEKLDLYLFQTP